jgi:NTE family protein
LSVLLPALEQRGQRPRIVIGTSVGALITSFLAANAHLPADQLITKALQTWESVHWTEVVERLVSAGSALRLGEYAGGVLGVPGLRLDSLLDPEPLRATLRERVDFNQIHRSVDAGELDAAAVVATSALTNRSVVFHDGLGSPPPDQRRGIDYVATPLQERHVLASAAIPAVFPAVHVQQPPAARGWYFDGGTRLNTPIKPALEFGAARVVVVALSSLAAGPSQLAGEQQPDALAGAGQILSGIPRGPADGGRPDARDEGADCPGAGGRAPVAPSDPRARAALAGRSDLGSGRFATLHRCGVQWRALSRS